MSLATPVISEAEYADIESAVLETMRGRWFLAEYARRNRHADTILLLAGLERLGAAVRAGSDMPLDRIRVDIIEMADAINRTKAEVAAIKLEHGDAAPSRNAAAELDAIVGATETATSDILAAAEQVQEIAWTMREQGSAPSEVCDELDRKATDIYTACSFQDLTGQRIRKIIEVLDYLDARINSLMTACGMDGADQTPARSETSSANEPAAGDDSTGPISTEDDGWTDDLLLNNDFAFGGDDVARDPEPYNGTIVPALSVESEIDEIPARTVAPEPAMENRPADSRAYVPPPRPGRANPFAAVDALSYEEKVALFS